MGRAQTETTSPRKRPAQLRSKETVEAILGATAHILAEVGYDALTTNAVAQRAGVSIGSLYQYFPSKDALVADLVDRHCDRMNAVFGSVFMRAIGLPHRALVKEVITAIMEPKLENPALARVLREQLPRVGRLRRLEESLEQITRVVAQYLEGHRAELRVACPERAAFIAVTMGESLSMAFATRRPADAAIGVEEITDAIMQYLFGDAGRDDPREGRRVKRA